MEQEIDKKIDGRKLATELLDRLESRVVSLKKKNITPTLAVIQVGNDSGSTAYIKMKRKAAKKIGVKVVVKNFPKSVFFQEIAETIHVFNSDPKIHGVIIQRPLPSTLSTSSFNTAVALEKDVDGFIPKSEFNPPIALAILQIFRHIFQLDSVTTHLKSKQIVIVGRGDTAGKPIAELLSARKIPFIQSYSKTVNTNEFTEEADIIISCVGKPNIITSEMINEGVILIGVGISRSSKRKLVGDYDEEDIEDKASFYTPTPGGIGPLNAAYLLSNLVKSAENMQLIFPMRYPYQRSKPNNSKTRLNP